MYESTCGLLNVCDRFDGFDFDDYEIFGYQIKTVANIELYAVVFEWQSDLG